jgi:CRISPR-associated protein Cmr1
MNCYKKIRILKYDNNAFDIKEIIKDLIIKKAQQRRNNTNADAEDRHLKFGTTKPPPQKKEDLPQGSKILPFIEEKNGQYSGGFLSIVGLLDLYEEGKNG